MVDRRFSIAPVTDWTDPRLIFSLSKPRSRAGHNKTPRPSPRRSSGSSQLGGTDPTRANVAMTVKLWAKDLGLALSEQSGQASANDEAAVRSLAWRLRHAFAAPRPL